jgi:CHAT domain-containing protein
LTRAAADYEGAIAALERDEDKVGRPQQRKGAYDEQRTAVREAVRFHAIVRRDPVTALGLAERARARVLRQTLTHETAAAPNPALAHTSLPHGVTVLYYVTLSDYLLGWVLTTDQAFQFTAPMDARRFRAVMHRVHKGIAAGATATDLESDLQYLESFIRPALNALTPGTTLVVIPDEGLDTVPFAALRDLKGTPLIKNYPLLLAPSYSTLLLASERLTDFKADSVVAIGDGHDVSEGGLPRLAHADAEAVAVSRVYPRATVFTGARATIRNVQNAIQPVVHFAGHTVANAEFPFLSQLLFAPDRVGNDASGVLVASDIVQHQFAAAKVVVLASCESLAGRFIPGEGFDSVARIFLDAGVPSVVGSLWPVDDDQSSLLIEFHRQLRATRDVARALRAAQLTALRNGADLTPLRRWAGFVAVGGVNTTHTREGVNQ